MDATPQGRREPVQPWSLLIVDAQEFTRHCMAELLRAGDGVTVSAVARVDDIRPDVHCDTDVVLLRLDSGYSGEARTTAILRRLHQKLPGVPVSLLAGHGDLDTSLAAVRDGARGYLSLALGTSDTLSALRLIAAGGVFIGPAHSAPPGETPAHSRADDTTPLLTRRESQVLAHLREGKPNKVIAYELGMSENTVKAHVGHILRKLNALNRTAVASMTPVETKPFRPR